ncbi:MAG: polysaccharide deacetylase family protein [Sporichthyaceae bacterium]
MRRPRLVFAAAITGMLLTACSDDGRDAVEASSAGVTTTPEAVPLTPTPTAEPTEASVAVDPASVKANELGAIPVMMYHAFKDPVCTACVYDQTPAEFRAELQRMHEANFVPITTAQLIAGDIDIPAGKRPVVLTFDDSSASQIQIGPDGSPSADSAVGILEAFAAENPDFVATASFYVNANAFNDVKALPWLVANGYEVGVHTMSHINLKTSSESLVQKELTQNSDYIKAEGPGAVVSTIALPFGISPGNKALLRGGSFEGSSYTLVGALLVGSNPAKSVFNADFDPYAIPRIRSGPKNRPVETDSTFWLDLLDQGKWTPYVSDGDPETIAYPSTSTAKIADDVKAKGVSYDPSGSAAVSSPSSSSATPAGTAAPSTAPSSAATP